MENDFALFCCSHSGDLQRAENLVKSMRAFNKDNIPIYFAVPFSDIKKFKHTVGEDGITFIEQETIYKRKGSGWMYQQVIKSCIWKLGIAQTYLTVDSDSYFIRDFHKEDFFFDKTPLTLIHDEVEYLSFLNREGRDNHKGALSDYYNGRDKIRKKMGRVCKKIYNFGPPPFIFDKRVWEAFEKDIIPEFGHDKLENFMINYGNELIWYGEAVLRTKAIPLYPTGPLFLVFDVERQYKEYKRRHITEEMIKKQYFGIGLQSNWKAPTNYELKE